MSHVTNVMVAVGVDNWGSGDIPPGIVEMNKTLAKEASGQILLCIDESVGGLKNLEIPVFAAAFNYVPIDVIINAAVDVPWNNPQQVQLMICDQDDYLFTVKTVEEWEQLTFDYD